MKDEEIISRLDRQKFKLTTEQLKSLDDFAASLPASDLRNAITAAVAEVRAFATAQDAERYRKLRCLVRHYSRGTESSFFIEIQSSKVFTATPLLSEFDSIIDGLPSAPLDRVVVSNDFDDELMEA